MTNSAARSVRIGLVADSHVGEFLDELPQWVLENLDGCDLILHAGDLSVMRVMTDLEAIAPVVAVRGDHDRDADALPIATVVAVGGWRIGLTHGSRGRRWDAVAVARGLAGDRSWQRQLEWDLCARFGAVDAVVYGHWHLPRVAQLGSALVVCPGAVCPGGALAEGNPIPRTAHAPVDIAVRRFRRTMSPEQHRATFAILHVGSSGIRPSLITGPAARTAGPA